MIKVAFVVGEKYCYGCEQYVGNEMKWNEMKSPFKTFMSRSWLMALCKIVMTWKSFFDTGEI